VALSATTSDATDPSPAVTYEAKQLPGGSWTAAAASWATGSLGDGDYSVHAIATDAAGNSTTSAAITVHVDNHAPTVAFSAPVQYVNAADGNSIAVTATSPDTDIAQVQFFDCPTANPGCSNSVGTDTSAPYSVSWDVSGYGD